MRTWDKRIKTTVVLNKICRIIIDTSGSVVAVKQVTSCVTWTILRALRDELRHVAKCQNKNKKNIRIFNNKQL